MRLYENMMDDCVLMEKTRTEDGAGGFLVSWRDGAKFKAAIVLDTTMQARIAEAEGVTSVYTVTTYQRTILDFHDVIKRISDGVIFRVTSNGNDVKSPRVSTLNMAQVKAERWELSR